MKKNQLPKILLWTSLLCILAFTWSCEKTSKESFVSNEEFLHPKNETKVHTWWHWMQGNLSKEGITKDLEAMKAQGIVQATILNVGHLVKDRYYGVPKVKFASDEWYNMFSWALQEAKRLDIKIGAHNCDGWSSSGGPWITPEQSMKMFTWSKITVAGNRNISQKIDRPFAKKDFYRDVAVVAYPAESLENSFASANPQITLDDTTNAQILSDGSPVSALIVSNGSTIVLKFMNPFKAEKLSILPRKEFSWGDLSAHRSNYALSVSDNGKTYKKIKEFEIKGLNITNEILFTPVSAKYFKLEIKSDGNNESWLAFKIAEIELLKKDEKPKYQSSIPFSQDKVGALKANDKKNFEFSGTDQSLAIAENTIIDITDKMKEDGTLNWDAPAGNWNIIRFGYTTTDAHNGPATKEGEGLECDKMDTGAIAYHFSQFPQKLIDKAGDMAGNTFKFLLIDSWECGYQNWTKAMPEEFEKRRGYKITNFIPALCGERVNDASTSEAFLYDFRKTVSELIEENYFKKFGELCHKNKMEMHAEVIYGGSGYPPLDVLRSNEYAEMPMFEFWAGHGKETFPEYTAQKTVTLDFTASAALFYDKKVFGSEAYTAMAHYSEGPWDLKPFGDRAFCTGINQMILHSYVNQPVDSAPGMTLGPFGSHFNRNNAWFNFAGSWIDYQSRIQSVLRKGQMQADVLYYVGDQLPQFLEPNKGNTVPVGYQIHVCNYDILKNKLTVKDGKLIFGNVKFSLLTLPENMGMELATLQRIEELVKNGVVVYGQKPTHTLSMKGLKENPGLFSEITNKLWGKIDGSGVTENTYGKGKVFWGSSMETILKKIGVAPDVETDQKDTATFLFTHRVMEDKDIYFVFNQHDQENKRNLFFRSDKSSAMMYNPQTGSVTGIAISKDPNGRIVMPFTFGPKESMIFVFSKEEAKVKPEAENKLKMLEISDIKGTISFNTRGYGENWVVNISALKSFTEFDQKEIKYFSGFATYDLSFSAPKDFVSSTDKVFIDMGVIGSAGSVSLNGESLGTVWIPGTQIEITGKLKEQNTLKVTVGNVYRNRIVGDYIEFGKLKNVFTSAPVGNFLNKTKSLKPSGLIGPLKLIKK